MAEELNLYQKLAKIRNLAEVMTKDKSGYGYKYVSMPEILARITGGMKRYGISLLTNLNESKVEPYSYTKTKVAKNGTPYEEIVNEYIFTAIANFQWVNDDNPEEAIETKWYVVGSQSDPSQAFGSALSYCTRYFYKQYFQIADVDSDDPDNWRSKQREAEDAENLEITRSVLEQINAIVSEYLDKNPDSRDKVAEIVKKYAKDKKGRSTANYNLITDPVTASALLQEIMNLKEN